MSFNRRAAIKTIAGVLGAATLVGVVLVIKSPVVIVLLGLLVGAGYVALTSNLNKKSSNLSTDTAGNTIKDATKELQLEKDPNMVELMKQLEALIRNATLHQNYKTPISKTLEELTMDSLELFKRMARAGNAHNLKLLALTYNNTFEKLNKSVGEAYYLDMITNEKFWSNVKQRKAFVEQAVRATYQQLLKNIQQVNNSQSVDFELDVDQLLNQATNGEELYGN